MMSLWSIVLVCVTLCWRTASSMYTDESLFIHIDISIQLSVASHLTSDNVQQIMENAIVATNEESNYLSSVARSILNVSSCYDGDRFAYHSIINVYYASQSAFNQAVVGYSQDMNSFVEPLQSHILSLISNAISFAEAITPDAVDILSINMIRGGMVSQYQGNPKSSAVTTTKTTTTTSITQLSSTHDNRIYSDDKSAASDALTFNFRYDIAWCIVAVFTVCLLLMCGCMLYIWRRQRRRHSQSNRKPKPKTPITTQSKDSKLQKALNSAIEQHLDELTAHDTPHNSVIDLEHTHHGGAAEGSVELPLRKSSMMEKQHAESTSEREIQNVVMNQDPWHWNTVHVTCWLCMIELQKYCDALTDVDGRTLLQNMTASRLALYGISEKCDIRALTTKIDILRLKSAGYQQWRNKHRLIRHMRQNTYDGQQRASQQSVPLQMYMHFLQMQRKEGSQTGDNSNCDTGTESKSEAEHERRDDNEYVYPPLNTVHKIVDNRLYFLSDDESVESEQQTVCVETNAEPDNKMKTVKKPPKKLRRKASQNKKLRESLSPSSTSTLAHKQSQNTNSNLRPQAKVGVPISPFAYSVSGQQPHAKLATSPGLDRREITPESQMESTMSDTDVS